MLSYVVSAVTSYLRPVILPAPSYDLALHASSKQEPACIPTFDDPVPATSSPKHTIIEVILRETNLYSILGLPPYSSATSALRHAYLSRSRACHPDKFPDYPPATLAFQKVSVAYEILSSPPSKQAYDARLRTRSMASSSNIDAEAEIFAAAPPAQHAHDIFHGVLGAIFADFMDGDFQMIRKFLAVVNEINPALNMGEESIESLINSFRALRELILVSQTYTHLIHLHLLRLLEIQHALRQLPYLDVAGRLRLTLRLARVALEMPVAVDRALCERAEAKEREAAQHVHGECGVDGNDGDDGDGDDGGNGRGRKTKRVGRRTKSGILPAKLATIICCLVVVLERSERVL